ncbi:class I SAM-dependent methyltransferase [Nostoc sp. DedQUE09]|uniref:class I SAM-dependent methyltransferase n=1 Tax=Nostoc sp. DedQUE09 TaxID=3075394 RepID=UPI002AD4B91F|nr:class I SAM-dependent methyltransferase [Nostoc sp. DedQUE09]MDZ7949478.1 class I SAM-dependent methyltransferase [Nostoc sp. DedQUE09]
MRLFQQKHLLVCPQCKAVKLDFLPHLIKCTSCAAKFTQVGDDWLNLMPNQLVKNNEVNQWQERLIEMEGWYQDLSLNTESLNNCFLSDYSPYAPLLATISGDVLDIGGGIGLPRHYLPPNTNYIVIDPSLEWLKTDWSSLIDSFPCLEKKPDFIQGIGEYLPFPSQSFDAVLSFWSLNHASDPKLVFSEVARVLRPNGKFLIVLEDMIPQWLDLLNPMFPAKKVFNSFFYLLHPKLAQKIFPRFHMFIKLLTYEQWPLQNDHICILGSEIKDWAGYNFDITRRVWINQYLTFELRKKRTK